MIQYEIKSPNIDELIKKIKPDAKLSEKAIKHITQDIVWKNIRENVRKGTDINGNLVKASQIGTRLYRTGNLYNSIGWSVKDKLGNVISTAEYAGFVNEGTSKMTARNFFGIGQKIEQEVENYLRTEKLENLIS